LYVRISLIYTSNVHCDRVIRHHRSPLSPTPSLYRSRVSGWPWLSSSCSASPRTPSATASAKRPCRRSSASRPKRSPTDRLGDLLDRKRTRMNSSHVSILYYVLCL